ncbi:MAG: cytochrome c3 family protein [Planctomycetaceae bacterium]
MSPAPTERKSEAINRTAGGDVVAASFTPPDTKGYVGSTACAECHESYFESYRSHPMYTGGTRAVTDDNDSPDGSTTALAGLTRSLEASVSESGAVVHSERMHDASGGLVYADDVHMQYVLGSGRRAKAYLHQRGEILCSSPLNWFEASGDWGLNPGYTRDDPRRFDRRVQANCLHCHTGQIELSERGSNRFSTNAIIESAIGCERCHGPGQAHVQFHEDSTTGVDPIVNPADLDRPERESVCYQCHLQPSYSRILRPGRSHLDFRPGMKFEDVWTMVDANTSVDSSGETKSVRQVQQMRESACYVQSGSMSCTSCHDPHRSPSPAEAPAFFRGRCLDCHKSDDACAAPVQDRQAKGGSCIACHMPKLDVQQAVHVSQTDHRVLRDAFQNRRLEAKSGIQFFDNQGDRLSAAERQRAIAIAIARKGPPYSDVLAEELNDLVSLFPTDAEVLIAHGSVCRLRGDTKSAIESFEKAAELPSSDELALTSLVEIHYEAGRWPEAVAAAARLLKINHTLSGILARKADALANSGEQQKGIGAAKEALILNPSLSVLHQWLAGQYDKNGDVGKQQYHQELFDRMQTAKPLPDVKRNEER